MEDLGTHNLEIGKRLVIILVFLSLMWFGLNYLVMKMKSGDLSLPDFLKNKLKGVDNLDLKDAHRIELVQKKYIADGTELMVLDIDGSHVLLARTVNGSICYIKDLES